MSRLERQRQQLAEERWPTLRGFISTEMADEILGDASALPLRFRELTAALPLEAKQKVAAEAWDMRSYFSKRYDDVAFLQDGLGAQGKLYGYKSDKQNGPQPGLRRMKLLYDAFAESIRTEAKDWQP